MSSKIVRRKSTDNVRGMTREQHYPLEVEDPDELANLPPDQVVSGRATEDEAWPVPCSEGARAWRDATDTAALACRMARQWLRPRVPDQAGGAFQLAQEQVEGQGLDRRCYVPRSRSSSTVMWAISSLSWELLAPTRKSGRRSTPSSSKRSGIPASHTRLSTGVTSSHGSGTAPSTTTASARPSTSLVAWTRSRRCTLLLTRL